MDRCSIGSSGRSAWDIGGGEAGDDPTDPVDTDGDGVGNEADTDDDGDGWLDTTEVLCRNAQGGLGDPNNADVMPVDNETDPGADGIYGTDDDDPATIIGDKVCNALDPDDDNDGDGILDRDDRCPMRPETFNRRRDRDGCPD